MKKLMYLITMVAILASLVGIGVACAPAPAPTPTTAVALTPTPPPAPTPTPKPVAATRPLVVAVKTEAITLDPHVNDFGYSQFPQRATYESLVNYEEGPDGKVKLVPMLAASWEVSADAKTVTLKLQKNVKFSDGTPLNAEAVKYNFERVFALKEQPSGRLPKIASIDVVDDLTVRLNLESPYAPVMAALAKAPLIVSPKAVKDHSTADDPWAKKWLHDHSVGTGPYLLEAWVPGQQITYNKNPNYWRGWEGNHVEKIVFRLVKEPATQKLMLEKGDADLADGILVDDLDALAKTPGVVVEERNTPAIYMMKMRFRGPLANKQVRQAIQLAFDYDAFIKGVLNNRAKKARGPLPSTVIYHDPTLPEPKRDIEKAKQLLAQAGYPDGKGIPTLVIQIIPSFGPFQPGEAQILQQNLAELGIKSTIDPKADAPSYIGALTELEKGPDIYAWTFNNSLNDPEDNFRREYYPTLLFGKGGTNGIFYNNPRVTELIDKGVSVSTDAERQKIYQEIQRILLDDAPAIFAAEPRYYLTRREVVKNFPYHPFVPNNGPDWWYVWLSK